MVKDGKRRSLREDSDDEMAGPDPFRNETVLGEGNEAYRVYDQLGDVPTAGGGMQGGGNATGNRQGQAFDGCCSFHGPSRSCDHRRHLEGFSKNLRLSS